MKYVFPSQLIDWNITSEDGQTAGCQFCAMAILNADDKSGLVATSADGRFSVSVVQHYPVDTNDRALGAAAMISVMAEMGGPKWAVDMNRLVEDAFQSDQWTWHLYDSGDMIADGVGDSRSEALKIASAFVAGMEHEDNMHIKQNFRRAGTRK